jgi:hypothetical protein
MSGKRQTHRQQKGVWVPAFALMIKERTITQQKSPAFQAGLLIV